jgi:hypothetical protein
VRTKHSNKRFLIERLELVTLLNNKGKWQVALNQQAPKATPIEGAGDAPPPVKPSSDPVKPSGSAKPPKPAPPKRKPAGR